MTCFVAHTSVDCRNAYVLSQWWKKLLGYADLPDDPNLPGHVECMIENPTNGHRILFIEVPDEKVAKNRLHLDLRPLERTRSEEVAWAQSLGATVVEDLGDHHGPGIGWVVMADPEGNEFCILRGLAEVAATA